MTNEFKFGKIANNPATDSANIAPAIEMGISNAPTRLIVKYITDMYSYPLEAAIRETVSNAIDAATKTGFGIKGVKAEVVEKNDRMFFRVMDKGPGMTPEKLVNVYTQYGVSDKREDEDATGAFGLGAKSPLAYTRDFHIITKTAEGECYYEHCYRTPSDDFLADPPVKVEGKAVVTDNLAVLNGASTTEIEVADPFAAGETGTLVEFPISYGDIRKAKGILGSIDRLIYHTGQGSITDTEYDTAPLFYNVGSFEIADADGDTIDASIYIIDEKGAEPAYSNRRNVGARTLPSVIRALAGKDGLTADMVAFKVGDWLYPANGGAWAYSEFSYQCLYPSYVSIVVDVPSKALPFIPSRDTIRSDNGNTNVASLVAFVQEKILETMNDPKGFADMFNWYSEGQTFSSAVARCFYGRDYCFDAASLDNGIFKVQNIANPAFSFTADLADLNTCGTNLAEALATPAMMMGYVERNSNGVTKMKHGPVITTDVSVAKIIGTDARPNATDRGVVGYGLAKSKKCADEVVGKIATVVAETEYAVKDMSKRVSAYPVTYSFPAGIGLIASHDAVVGAGKAQALVIVDGSQHGVSKVRAGIGRVFDNNDVLADGDNGMFAIIPPKGEGKTWTADEITEMVATMTKIGKTLFNDVVYIPSSKVVSSLSKIESNGMSEAERGEIDKMFSTNRICTMLDENANGTYRAFGGNGHSSTANLGSRIAEEPERWGVIVADKAYNQAYTVAYEYARAAFALGLVPEGIKQIACIGANHYNKARAELLAEKNITVIYDDSDLSKDTAIASGAFNYYNGRVSFTGEVSDEIAAYKDHKTNEQADSNIRSMWYAKLGGYSWRSRLSMNVDEMIDAFTFGHESYAKIASAHTLNGWVAEIIDSITLNYTGKKDNETEAMAARLGDILEIWNARCKQASINIDLNSMTASTLKMLLVVGRSLGIENDIEAYYMGVPADDIIA